LIAKMMTNSLLNQTGSLTTQHARLCRNCDFFGALPSGKVDESPISDPLPAGNTVG
jgi:hypothetical protein